MNTVQLFSFVSRVHSRFAIFAALVLSATISRGAILHVTTTGNDAASGASWALAKRSITNAMVAAVAGDQIWVASGVYTQLVTLSPDVSLYGGFAGNETALAQRNWQTNFSILFGNGNGTVITITSGGPNTRVDGMDITGGFAIFGGGISSVGAAPVLANNVIYRNECNGGAGAGLFIFGFQATTGAQPLVTNNVVYQNYTVGVSTGTGSSYGDGAGIAVGNSSPVIAWNRIIGNLAARNGGGIGFWENSQAILANNIIEGNAASSGSGLIGIGGGILASANDFNDQPVLGAISSPTIVNNLIAANGADYGGGISLADSIMGAATVVNNTIVANLGSAVQWGNTSPTNYNNIIAFNSAGFEAADASVVTLRNNDVFGNSVLGGNTDYLGLPNATGLNGNISADPLLANYPIGDFHIQPNSPCVNAGSNAAVVAGWPDIGGNTRVVGAAVDIGAYESSGVTYTVPDPIVYVSPTGNDLNDGLTWATAKRTVQAGINAAAPSVVKGAEVWVAQGTYTNHLLTSAFVYLYGGFAGNETTRAARNIAAHPTILDGGGQPTVIFSRNGGYLVSAIDGFSIQNGGTFTAGSPYVLTAGTPGGAINCTVSAPIIANNLIRFNSIGSPNNTSQGSLGGAIYCYLAHAQITGNTISDNEILDVIEGSGGGIYFVRSKPTVQQNVFRSNHALYGSAVSAFASSLLFTGNTVISNSFYYNFPYQGAFEGAVFLQGCNNFVISGNTIEGNWAGRGGGIDLGASYVGQIANNVLFQNLAENPTAFAGEGGGIYCEIDGQDIPGNIAIVNNTFVGNSAPGGLAFPDMGGGIAFYLVTNTLELANNIFAFNSGGIYEVPGSVAPLIYRNNCLDNTVNYTGTGGGAGDILADPQFVNLAAVDFHLSTASPCIDAGASTGAPTADKDGVPRPLDGRNSGTAAFEIGAYEYVNPLADTDHDGMPDGAELIAGTDPTNPNSVLKLQGNLPAPGHAMVLSWLSVTGRTYTVQFKSAVNGGAWQTLTNNLQGTGPLFTGALLQVQDPLHAGTNRFYRLGVKKN